MSLPKVVVAALLTSLAASAAHADETATPSSVRASLEAPEAPREPAASAAPARTVKLVLSADLGLTAVEGQLGARYRWLEVDLGLRTRTDSTEKFGGVKLLVHPDGPIVPFAYAQVGQWTTTVVLDVLGHDHPDRDGLMFGGGAGIEVPMGRVATLTLHFGVDQQVGNGAGSSQVDAGLGFGVRL